ncbi:MAG: GNAT family N-acetyltransferase [Halieaceae bacterium]
MSESRSRDGVHIRPAKQEDIGLILDLIKGLATYEKAPEQAKATPEDIDKALFHQPPRAHALICSVDGQPAGFALYFYNFSTWTGKSGVYLEDLFVEPAFRGRGAGKALLRRLAQVACEQDCARFEWSVLDWNEPAIKFYEAFGAQAQSEWVGYRLSGNALKAFANSSD